MANVLQKAGYKSAYLGKPFALAEKGWRYKTAAVNNGFIKKIKQFS